MIGTMVLVLMGCGSAVLPAGMAEFCRTGVGTVSVALAFGLSVVAMAYAIGGVSGCHINPAITLSILFGSYEWKRCGYVYAFPGYRNDYQFGLFFMPRVTTGGHDGPTAFQFPTALVTARCYRHSSQSGLYFHFCIGSALGSTDRRGGELSQNLAIGLSSGYWLHIVCIPITGTSVNPARSIGPALFRVEKRCRSYGCLLWRRL